MTTETTMKPIVTKELYLSLLSVVTALFILCVPVVQAAEPEFSVSARNLTATAEFTRATPCAAYELSWGDGTVDSYEEDGEICIQMLDDTTLTHAYDEAGTYTTTLTLGDAEYTDTVTVPVAVTAFGLADVANITAQYVDPNKMMADEEYYIYTIELTDGSEVEVETAAFTMLEYRNQQFADAGYTGDVDALLALVSETPTANVSDDEDSVETPDTAEGDEDATTVETYKTLLEVLQTLVAKMQQLLEMR